MRTTKAHSSTKQIHSHRSSNVLKKPHREDLAICNCRGQGRCGRLLSRSQRYRHKVKQKEREKQKEQTEFRSQYPTIAKALKKRNFNPPTREPTNHPSLSLSSPPSPVLPPPLDIDSPPDQNTAMSPDIPHVLHSFAMKSTFDITLQESEVESETEEGDLDNEDQIEMEYDQAAAYVEEEEEEEEHRRLLEHANDRLRLEADILRYNNESLTQDQRDIIVSLAYHQRYVRTKEGWEASRKLFPGRVNLPSYYMAKKLLTALSELDAVIYHCCVDSCCSFTGQFDELTACPFCSEPRLDSRGRPRNTFRYIPLIPRLKNMFLNQHFTDLLSYRVSRPPFQGEYSDVFDSLHYLNLLKKHVVVDGKTLPHKYGEFPTDIFIGLLLDGVSLFKNLGARQSKNNYSCWPIEVVIYNLSPEIRTQLKYVFSLGIIPGPREPKHLNSFMYPFYMECVMGSQGISALHLNSGQLRRFTFHFYLLFASGDIKAMIKFRCTRGPNSISPCHVCHIKGVRDPGKPNITTHYVPHTRPGETTSQIHDLLTHPRTHEEYLKTYAQLDDTTTEKEHERIAKEAGVNGRPILGMLHSVDIVHSAPYGFVHQFCLNLPSNMIAHWRGDFKGIDASNEGYRISDIVWKMIGEETARATKTIPASMVRKIPDIFIDRGSFNAESFLFWMTWLSPYLLHDRFPDPKFYSHHLLLIDFIRQATAITINQEMLTSLTRSILKWHEQYEVMYYRAEAARLPTVPLTIHAVVHTPFDIVWSGPSDVLWEWVTERKMGVIARSVTSRRFPFSQLSNTVLRTEQLKLVQLRYGLTDEELMLVPERDWSKLAKREEIDKELSASAVLRAPFDRNFALDNDERKRLAKYFRRFLPSNIPLNAIVDLIPMQLTKAGGIRVLNEKEAICGSWAASRLSADRHRDSSFVRLGMLQATRRSDGSIVDIPTCSYAQIHYILQAELPPNSDLGISDEIRALLAYVSPCGTTGDATQECVWYSDVLAPQYVHVNTIQCVVGRIRVDNRWGIIDMSLNCSRTSFLGPEDVDEEL